MIYKLTVPAVAEDVQEVRVLDWLFSAGDRFAVGALIVELETHKAIVEVRAAQPGVLRQSLVPAGGWCRTGLPLALFSDISAEPLPEDPAHAQDLLTELEIA